MRWEWRWCADVDECIEPVAESCRQSDGVCDGFHPPGGFSCQCGVGYQLANNSITECVGNCLSSSRQHCHQYCRLWCWHVEWWQYVNFSPVKRKRSNYTVISSIWDDREPRNLCKNCTRHTPLWSNNIPKLPNFHSLGFLKTHPCADESEMCSEEWTIHLCLQNVVLSQCSDMPYEKLTPCRHTGWYK